MKYLEVISILGLATLASATTCYSDSTCGSYGCCDNNYNSCTPYYSSTCNNDLDRPGGSYCTDNVQCNSNCCSYGDTCYSNYSYGDCQGQDSYYDNGGYVYITIIPSIISILIIICIVICVVRACKRRRHHVIVRQNHHHHHDTGHETLVVNH